MLLTNNILKNFWVWLALVILFLVLIIMRVPASFAAYAFTQAVPGLSLAEVRGSLWKGSAGSATISVDRDVYSLGRFQWDIDVSNLITLKPCAEVAFAFQNQSANGYVCAQDQRVQLEDFSLNIPAALLDLWFSTSLNGDVSLMVNKGVMVGERIEQLEGNFSWRDGAFHDGKDWIKVGSFGANLKSDNNGGVDMDVVDLGGPVFAELDINYNPVARPNDEYGFLLNGQVGVREAAHPNLKPIVDNTVGAIGEQTEQGYRFEWQQ